MGGSSTDDTALLKAVTDGPMAALEVLVAQHRNSHVNLIQAMRDAEARHSQVCFIWNFSYISVVFFCHLHQVLFGMLRFFRYAYVP